MKHQDRAYAEVRHQLLEGTLRTRHDFSRRRLATKLGVSPSCVHSVLQRLEVERLVDSRPQAGTWLREVDWEEYHQLYDLRELIEPYAAARAARWIDDDQLAIIEQACEDIEHLLAELETGARPRDVVERTLGAEQRFHGTIMAAARNPMAGHFVENLRILSYVRYAAQVESQTLDANAWWDLIRRRMQKTAPEHRRVLDALRRGDAQLARRLMLRHIRRGRERLGLNQP
jgi:DNA-binding GntR family transcriptional regulator